MRADTREWIEVGIRIFLNAVTRLPRNEMITRAERAISESGGWVLGHHLYSNLAISLAFEITVANMAGLLDHLQETALALTSESVAKLTSFAKVELGSKTNSNESVTGYLHITFIHNEPDLRRDVPAIPG